MNKNSYWIALILILALGLSAGVAAKERKFQYPPLREITVPPVTTGALPSGLKLYLMEDHGLPMVQFQVLVRTGSAFDPRNMAGLCGATMELMRAGGIPDKTGDELDQMLNDMGAVIRAGADTDSAFISGSCLAKDAETVLGIVDDMLRRPALAQDKLDLIKVQRRSAISRRNDDPAQIAAREFSRLVYGADSPYARQIEYAGVDAMTRDAVVSFHRQFVQPGGVAVGVWGDFQTGPMKAWLSERFGSWQNAGPVVGVFPEVRVTPAPSIRLVVKKDVNQSNIRLGHIGIRMDNPDYFAVEMMNSIFGTSGFLSRLMQIARTEHGLTYGIQGGIDAQRGYLGQFVVGTSTKSESTVDMINIIIGEINRIRNTPVSDAELNLAREAFLNSYVFQYASTFNILTRMMSLDYFGFPPDFMQTFQKRIAGVTAADVRRVANTYLHPDKLTILVVGNPDQFGKPLSEIGAVQELDITIPAPAAAADEAPAATPASLARGQVLLSRMIDAMKAGDKLDTLAGMHLQQKSTLQLAPQMSFTFDVDSYTFLPDQLYVKMASPIATIVRAFDGKAGWMQMPQGIKDLSAADIQEVMESIAHSPLVFLKHSRVEGAQAVYAGRADVMGRSYESIYIPLGEGKGFRVYADPDTGMLAGLAYAGNYNNEPGQFIQLFSNPAELDGLSIPRDSETYFNGKKVASGSIQTLELNPARNPELFQKPVN